MLSKKQEAHTFQGWEHVTEFIYLRNLTQKEALAEAKKRKGRILTNKEIDSLIQQDILNPVIFPLWTGTHLEYDEKTCKITENNKTVKCKMPDKDGWYEQDKFGLPFGKPSNDGNKNARYLWRLEKNSGLVARWYLRWDGWYRRFVYCYEGPSRRLGVLILTG